MPKLVRQFTSRNTGNIKLVHQLDVGAARRSSAESEEQFRRRIKSRIEVQSPSAECSSVELFKRGSSAEDKSSWMRRNQLGRKPAEKQVQKPAGKPVQQPARWTDQLTAKKEASWLRSNQLSKQSKDQVQTCTELKSNKACNALNAKGHKVHMRQKTFQNGYIFVSNGYIQAAAL
ncbi:hypothetical protein F511_39397 [Dorcoceras hygrometricum]|uniref:Uncharacterized protein n=1 Tax=Dorcoceras hygrometricum TaxID=472368 RepID=A0A2Z7DAN6_9LAMI|nr:hypothetical protein F511_39397 [Dorcoceras hygrometricum]